ncbi:MAG TPA: membrane protein insertase YidC [Gammaproteobacteria bacterium]|nr:membrane protein insertase YidC [Gammaproteobacteria bacterium]
MEQQRTLLFIGLLVLGFLLWQNWQRDYAPPPPAPTTPAQGPATPAVPDEAGPVPSTPAGGSTPDSELAAMPLPQSAPATPGHTPAAPVERLASAERIHVTTDVYRIEIDTRGGDLRRVDLLQYPVDVDHPDVPYRLMDDVAKTYIAQSGLFSPQAASEGFVQSAPSHRTVYRAERREYMLADGEETLEVRLHWTSPDGVRFTKTYVFKRGSYTVTVKHRIENAAALPWRGNVYYRLRRSAVVDEGSATLPTYTGPVYYSPDEHYQEVEFEDIDDAPGFNAINRDITGGWAAMSEHYFLGAWIPDAKENFRYFTARPDTGVYVIGLASGEHQVAPGESAELSSHLFVGPKLQDILEDIAPGLELTVDYSWLTIIAKPLFWLLSWLHSFIGNWGWAIIALTILIKAAFYKLSETSYRSMAKMKKLHPKLQDIQRRYAGDRQRKGQAMMELYKKEGVNPLGGCLPILIQIPVFIALYWVLLESVELRQADWILWYRDLSTMDPYYVLPLIMGATMFLQQKLNPTQMDPTHQKMMMLLPVVFTVFFLWFPSGLVLYWVTNNILSIAQQWYITRRVLDAGK